MSWDQKCLEKSVGTLGNSVLANQVSGAPVPRLAHCFVLSLERLRASCAALLRLQTLRKSEASNEEDILLFQTPHQRLGYNRVLSHHIGQGQCKGNGHSHRSGPRGSVPGQVTSAGCSRLGIHVSPKVTHEREPIPIPQTTAEA